MKADTRKIEERAGRVLGSRRRWPRRRAVCDVRRGLAVRDRFALGQLSWQGLAWWRTRLTRQLEDLVTPLKSHAANETFAKFLERPTTWANRRFDPQS